MLDSSLFDLISEIGHFFTFSIKGPKTSLEKGMLIVSTDIDVGSSKLGILNKGRRDRDVNDRLSEYQIGRIEELSVPLIVKAFDDFGIPITLGVRGQLTEIDNRVLESLLSSETKHDIGAHGYYHKEFSLLTRNEAEDELYKISAGMEKYGLNPETFIFPKNSVAHLDLLEKYKYVCYRGYGDILRDSMNIEKQGQLYNIKPSFYINKNVNLTLLKNILDISIRKRLPFHIWFHFWQFGEDEKKISKMVENFFIPFLNYAKEKQESGLLAFENMRSAARKIECSTRK